MNILFIGSSGSLSIIPLQGILQSEHNVCTVAMDQTQTNPYYNYLFPVTSNTNETYNSYLNEFSQNNALPVLIFNHEIESYIEEIKTLKPDIIIVSCFAKKLPPKLLTLPTYGCFNLHPSLLPKFRGPNPIFWQFKEGVESFGVSLHKMTNEYDAGEIINQVSIKLDDGTHHLKAEKILAHLAANLIDKFLLDVQTAIANAAPQNNKYSSYQHQPLRDEYTINTKWPARRLYNFLMAYKGENKVFPCTHNGQVYNLFEAIDFDPKENCELKINHNRISLPCSPGCLRATLYRD